KTSIFSHPVYLFLREFSLQDFRGGSVWRTVYYRFATKEEREGKMSTNLIFKECRQSAAMKRVLAVYGVKR
ncbi:hypothetical protein MZD78_25605, partial [Escherichia coli]|nr:hypothetical protein [Escherichia coli]MCK2347807.1 hypothetical protein [Escherichia coli]